MDKPSLSHSVVLSALASFTVGCAGNPTVERESPSWQTYKVTGSLIRRPLRTRQDPITGDYVTETPADQLPNMPWVVVAPHE